MNDKLLSMNNRCKLSLRLYKIFVNRFLKEHKGLESRLRVALGGHKRHEPDVKKYYSISAMIDYCYNTNSCKSFIQNCLFRFSERYWVEINNEFINDYNRILSEAQSIENRKENKKITPSVYANEYWLDYVWGDYGCCDARYSPVTPYDTKSGSWSSYTSSTSTWDTWDEYDFPF